MPAFNYHPFDDTPYDALARQCHIMEKELNVANLLFQGVRIWPLVKLLIHHTSTMAANDPKTKINAYNGGEFQLDKAGREAFRAARGMDVLCSTKDYEYAKRDGHYHNKFFDPLIEMFDNQVDIVKAETPFVQPWNPCPRRIPSIEYGIHKTLTRIPLNKLTIQGWKCFYDLDPEAKALLPPQTSIVQACLSVFRFRDLYLDILKEAQPKLVLFICHYQPMCMGLSLACRELSIPCADVQHGNQYNHLFYHWPAVPEGGYAMLPDYFWVWNRHSANDKRGWVSKHSPKPVVAGCPWHTPSDTKKSNALRSLCQRRSKVVLVTLPCTFGAFPENIHEAIRRSPDDWLWLIRSHPAWRGSEHDVKSLFSGMEKNKVHFDLANSLSIEQLLSAANHHITLYSSSLLEAFLQHVPSTLVDVSGKCFFGSLIKDGNIGYAEHPDDIIASIKQPLFSPAYDDFKSHPEGPNQFLSAVLDDAL